MHFFSEDDIDIRNMTDCELANAWWLWFTLAQNTNDSDPPFSHGCLGDISWEEIAQIIGTEAVNELRMTRCGRLIPMSQARGLRRPHLVSFQVQ